MSTSSPQLDLSYEATLREVATSQGTLRYHEAGDGPPLLMLHGSGPGVSGWRNFGDNLAAFAPHFRCLILEFPGFGVSDDTENHPMMETLPAVNNFLEALNLDRVDIVGNSMGGMVGTQFAIAQPERVGKLVTVGGMGRSIFSPAPGEGIKLLVEFTENPTRERLVEWLNSMVYDQSLITEELIEERWAQATDPATLASARKMYNRFLLKMMAAPHQGDEPPYWAMLHKIKAQTLMTWGRDDRVSPMDMALLPMRTIPHVELHVFPNCGHWTMIEQKAAWEATVLAFLRRPEPKKEK